MSKTLVDSSLQITEQGADGLVIRGYDTKVPETTAGTFAVGAEIINKASGLTYKNTGTTASPSWVDENSIVVADETVGGNLAVTGTSTLTGVLTANGATNTIGASTKLSQNTVKGRLKLDVRPTGGTTEDYALQIRSESGKTSASHLGIDAETHLKASGTASIHGTRGVAVLDGTFTSTGGDLIGTYGQARSDGTYNNASGFMAGVYGLIENSVAPTASHVTSVWADSHQNNAVTGNHELVYMSNNGSASLDQVMYASGQAEALIHLNTAGGPSLNYVTDTAETAGAAKKIKILVEGIPYYINIYPGA